MIFPQGPELPEGQPDSLDQPPVPPKHCLLITFSGKGKHRRRTTLAATCLLSAFTSWAQAGDLPFPTVTAESVVQRLTEMDQLRANELRGYLSERRYTAENPKFSKYAEVVVRESFTPPDRKELDIVSEQGASVIRRRVIEKLIEAEREAALYENDQIHMTLSNYEFRMVGAETVDGYSCFVLEVTPRSAKKYLMEGKIWVDMRDFAIVRMEGSPSKKPSMWTRNVRFVRRYEKHGSFWLPASVESESDILFAGESTLKIEYSGYRIAARGESQDLTAQH